MDKTEVCRIVIQNILNSKIANDMEKKTEIL